MERIKEDSIIRDFSPILITLLSDTMYIQFSSSQASQVNSGKNNANSLNVQTYLLALVY